MGTHVQQKPILLDEGLGEGRLDSMCLKDTSSIIVFQYPDHSSVVVVSSTNGIF